MLHAVLALVAAWQCIVRGALVRVLQRVLQSQQELRQLHSRRHLQELRCALCTVTKLPLRHLLRLSCASMLLAQRSLSAQSPLLNAPPPFSVSLAAHTRSAMGRSAMRVP